MVGRSGVGGRERGTGTYQRLPERNILGTAYWMDTTSQLVQESNIDNSGVWKELSIGQRAVLGAAQPGVFLCSSRKCGLSHWEREGPKTMKRGLTRAHWQ
jgi:hypothetical protein